MRFTVWGSAVPYLFGVINVRSSSRNRQVVQRRQRFWIHQPRKRPGSVRAFPRDQRFGFPYPAGGPTRVLRSETGTQGAAGRECQRGLIVLDEAHRASSTARRDKNVCYVIRRL